MKIAVLVSGGVDSAVALRILKDQGHDLTAFYLKIWLEDELSFLGNCPWEEDLKFVRKICKDINVPLKIIPLQKEYFETVVEYTISEVSAGRTPNPDIMCNSRIKFGLFLDKIDKSYEKVSTGHYAQIEEHDGIFFLKCSPDPMKDQTYFLSNLNQEQLCKLIFPIGHLTKKSVRKLAADFDLPNKDRKDSQGICFLGKIPYAQFVKHYLGEKPGDIIEFETGRRLGEHEGYWYYTIGQRKGIKLSGGPYFVVKKDIPKNIIYVSASYHAPDKKRNLLTVENFNWFADRAPARKNLKVKLRHGPYFHNAALNFISENKAEVTLDSDDQGIAPGQFAAFYDGEICLGSATIADRKL
ncbi:MAG: tRNA 2-thiouridine(34) synthase MnmA [Candidatus Peregrinibacteria bacterium]